MNQSDTMTRCAALMFYGNGNYFVCWKKAKLRRPLCEAHATLLEVTDVMIMADNGVVYQLIAGGEPEGE